MSRHEGLDQILRRSPRSSHGKVLRGIQTSQFQNNICSASTVAKFSWDHEDLDHDGLNRWAHGILRESVPSDDLDPIGRLTGIANEGTDG